MSDSTPFLDDAGIRREHPVLPQRHAISEEPLRFLALLAHLGEPGSVERQGWDNLLRVHGFEAVLRAAARYYYRAGPEGVGNAQAQSVLDGNPPGGHEAIRHALTKRRTKVA